MNENFCILHEAAGAERSIENFEFIVHYVHVFVHVHVFVNKTRT